MGAAPPRPGKPDSYPRAAPIQAREIRLVSGLILAAFLATHFSNDALGLISIDAMEAGRAWFNAAWRNPKQLAQAPQPAERST